MNDELVEGVPKQESNKPDLSKNNIGYVEVLSSMQSSYLDLAKIIIENFNSDFFIRYVRLTTEPEPESEKINTESELEIEKIKSKSGLESEKINSESEPEVENLKSKSSSESEKFQIDSNLINNFNRVNEIVPKLYPFYKDTDLKTNIEKINEYIKTLEVNKKNKSLSNIYQLFNFFISEINDIHDLHINSINKKDKFELLNTRYINGNKRLEFLSKLFDQNVIDQINKIINKLSINYNSMPMIVHRVEIELEQELEKKAKNKSIDDIFAERSSHKKLVNIFEKFRSKEPEKTKVILNSIDSYKDFISIRISRLSTEYNFSEEDYQNAYKEYVEKHVYNHFFINLSFNLDIDEFRSYAYEKLHRNNIKASESLIKFLEEIYNDFVIKSIEKEIHGFFRDDNKDLQTYLNNLINLYKDSTNHVLPSSEKNFKKNLRDIFENYLSRKKLSRKDINYEGYIDLAYNNYINDLFSVLLIDFNNLVKKNLNSDELIKYLNQKLYHNQFLVKLMADKFNIYFKDKYNNINDFSNSYERRYNQNLIKERKDLINIYTRNAFRLIDNIDYFNDFIKNIFYIDKYQDLFNLVITDFEGNQGPQELELLANISSNFDQKYKNIDGSFNFFKRIFVTKGLLDYKIKQITANQNKSSEESKILSKLQNLSGQINLIVNLEDELISYELKNKELLELKELKKKNNESFEDIDVKIKELNNDIKLLKRNSYKLLIDLFSSDYRQIFDDAKLENDEREITENDMIFKETNLLINLKNFFKFNLGLLSSLRKNVVENSSKNININNLDNVIVNILKLIDKPQNKDNTKKIKELIHFAVSQFDQYKGDKEFYTGVFSVEIKLIDTIDLMNEIYESRDSVIDKKTIPDEMLTWNLGENPLSESFKIVSELIKRTKKRTSFLFDPLKILLFSKLDKFKNDSFSILQVDSIKAYNEKLNNIAEDTKNTIKNWWNYEIGRAENANLTETAKRAIYNTVYEFNPNVDNDLLSNVGNIKPIELLTSLIHSQIESYAGKVKDGKKIEVLLPEVKNYSVLIFRSTTSGEIQAKKILIDSSLIGNPVNLSEDFIKQLSQGEQGWQKIDPKDLQRRNSEFINQGIIKKAIPSQISELSDYLYSKFFGREKYEQRVKNQSDQRDANQISLNEKYNDPNDIFHSHMIFSISKQENQEQAHPLNDLLMNPYLYGAWAACKLQYDRNNIPKLITNHNHTKVDGATARDVIGKNFERATINAINFKDKNSSENLNSLETNEENLYVDQQVLVNEKESNFTKIFNVKFDDALESGINFTDACSEIFIFFKDYGFNFNAHNIEQLIIMNAFDIDNSHFLENRNGVLIPVPQILSPVSKDFLQWKTETILKNKQSALQHFLELCVDNRINTSLRKQTVADNGLPIVPIISDMAGSNRLAMRELLQMSGLIAIASETKMIGQSYLVSNVSNQKDPVNKERVTQDEFTTAGSGAYPEFSIGIYNSLDGSTNVSFRTDNRAKKKYTQVEVQSRLMQSTRKIMAMFNTMKLIIKDNPELASMILK